MSAVLETVEGVNRLSAPRLGRLPSVKDLYHDPRFLRARTSDHPIIYTELPRGITRYNFTAGFFERQLIGWVREESLNSEAANVIRLDAQGVTRDGKTVFSRNGEVIMGAQDPALGQYNGKPNLTVVETTPHPTEAGHFITRSRIYELSQDGEKLIRDNTATGEDNGKDDRVADLGEGKTLIIPRIRTAVEHPTREELVQSHLQAGVVKASENLSDLSESLASVKKSPNLRLNLLAEDPNHNVWFGANSLTPLLSESRYRFLPQGFKAIGIVYHLAQFVGERFPNTHRARAYFAASAEMVVNLERGEVVYVSESRIIGALRMLRREIPMKIGREDINNVFFPGNLLMGITTKGEVAATYLTYGANDTTAGFLGIDYPFSAKPDPDLNKTSVVPLPILEKYLAA